MISVNTSHTPKAGWADPISCVPRQHPVPQMASANGGTDSKMRFCDLARRIGAWILPDSVIAFFIQTAWGFL